MKKFSSFLFATLMSLSVQAQQAVDVNSLPNEKWWGAATGLGSNLPFRPDGVGIDLRTEDLNNQTSPLLLSSKGRYVWCDGPFSLLASQGNLLLTPVRGEVHLENGGATLRDAYLAASRQHFPASGQLPPEEFITRPIYNTWIELVYNQNQDDVLRYAHSILAHGFSPGVLIIDDNWQKDYGDFEFRAEKFPDPKAMVDELHQLGFKVMLWVSPFVSPDSKKGRDLGAKGYMVKRKGTSNPYVAHWWNGYSYVYDLSNPEAFSHLVGELRSLQNRYGIDGFKFDAGDPESYLAENVDVFDGRSFDVEQTYLWAKMGQEFAYNEFRACWQHGGEPLVQRLGDKKYSWEGVSQLVPDMISAGLLGHAFTCPDMIGGGEYTSFYGVDENAFDQTLVVRSCQIHAMMPIMQFSVAPWRILSEENLAICLKYAKWHEELAPYLLEQARYAARTGEPIVRHMAYSFPGEGFEEVTDQYMLGNRYLVAPVTSADYRRDVKLPRGKWRDDQGKVYRGGRTYSVNVPLSRLPWFEKMK